MPGSINLYMHYVWINIHLVKGGGADSLSLYRGQRGTAKKVENHRSIGCGDYDAL